MSEEKWLWIIGIFLLFVYTQGRFNTPENRSTMTDARYYLAFFFYFLSLAFLFALLGGGISASHSIVKWLMLGGDQPLKTIEWLPGPLLSALLLTTLLPNFPVLKKIDEWLRKSFEKLGNIPQEVKSLCKGMYESEFIIPQELHDTIEQNLPGFSERDIRFVPDETLQYKWTKISSLYVQIIHWENLREEANEEAKKYREFVESQKKIYKMVTSRYEKVRSQAMNFFRCQSLGESIPYAVIEKCVINFREQVNELFNQLCVFIANGVLHCESTKIERKNKLRKMGFVDIIEKREPLNVNQAMTISVIVFLIMSAGMLIIGSLLGTKELFIHRVLVISIQVSIIYGFSVVASVYPKTVWKFANKEQVKYWPVVAYLLSGCIAVILAFIVGLTFRFIFIEHGDFLKALFDVRWKYPWFIMSFVVASVTAWLCDWFSPKEETEPRWSHWAKGITLSIILTLAALLVYAMLKEMLKNHNMPPEEESLELLPLLLRTAVIGFFIGYFIPKWYWEVQHKTYEKEHKSIDRLQEDF